MSIEDVLIYGPLVVVIAMSTILGVAVWALYRRWLAHEQLDEIHRRERLRILLRGKQGK